MIHPGKVMSWEDQEQFHFKKCYQMILKGASGEEGDIYEPIS
jgi:hypothetical protein